jgi:hypothetical protein
MIRQSAVVRASNRASAVRASRRSGLTNDRSTLISAHRQALRLAGGKELSESINEPSEQKKPMNLADIVGTLPVAMTAEEEI